MAIHAPVSAALSLVRLLQLSSPSLPVGGFTYSQGLEWAVEAGWVRNRKDLEDWLTGLLHDGITRVDVPILTRMYRAAEADDGEGLARWSDLLIACRESSELRAEERARGRAMTALLKSLNITRANDWQAALGQSQVAGFALAALHWGVPLKEAAVGYTWSWLENLVLAGVKLVPLGQTDGQKLLLSLGQGVGDAVDNGLELADESIGGSAPAAAIAAGRHETQYTRLFRS